MSTSKDVDYRVALAAGFLAEAEQDFTLERWRSCVDNAQLAVENTGKAALALFGDLFTQQTAEDALQSARRLVQCARELLAAVEAWRREQAS